MTAHSTAIRTFSGLSLDLEAPTAGAICLEDVAAGLSKVCRFGGQSLRFYSVAQHALAVSLTIQRLGHDDELALSALHHDSHEAYTCDIPSPLKRMLEPRYGEITGQLDKVIATSLGVTLPDKRSRRGRVIKQADAAVLQLEADELLNGGRDALGSVPELDSAVGQAAKAGVGDPSDAWSVETAAANFDRHHRLLAGDH